MLLLDEGAEIDAQSDRTKDTALSLACSGGRLQASHVFPPHSGGTSGLASSVAQASRR